MGPQSMRTISEFTVKTSPQTIVNDALSLAPSLMLSTCSLQSPQLQPPFVLAKAASSLPLIFLFAQCLLPQWGRETETKGREKRISGGEKPVVTYQGLLPKMKVSKYAGEKWKMVL